MNETVGYRNKNIKDKYIGLRNRYIKVITEKKKLEEKVRNLENEIIKLKKFKELFIKTINEWLNEIDEK